MKILNLTQTVVILILHTTTCSKIEASQIDSITSSPSISPSATPVPGIDPASLSMEPSQVPSLTPSMHPSKRPSRIPSLNPSKCPTNIPTTKFPSSQPSLIPSKNPSLFPTTKPTKAPSINPTKVPTIFPSSEPSVEPSVEPTSEPVTFVPTVVPTITPSIFPSNYPTINPTVIPTNTPSIVPSMNPSIPPTVVPSTLHPSPSPTEMPSNAPTYFCKCDGFSIAGLGPSSIVACYNYNTQNHEFFGIYLGSDRNFQSNLIISNPNYPLKLELCAGIGFGVTIDNIYPITASGIGYGYTAKGQRNIYNLFKLTVNTYGVSRCDGESTINVNRTGSITCTIPHTMYPSLEPSFSPTNSNLAPRSNSSTMLSTLPTQDSTCNCYRYYILDLGPESISLCHNLDDSEYFGVFLGTDTMYQANLIFANPNYPSNFSACFGDVNVNFNNKYPLDSYGVAYIYNRNTYNIYVSIGSQILAVTTCGNGMTLNVSYNGTTKCISPSQSPSVAPSISPSLPPSSAPTVIPTSAPSVFPTCIPSQRPSRRPSNNPTVVPSVLPSPTPTAVPSITPSITPTSEPSVFPTQLPTLPTIMPTFSPTWACVCESYYVYGLGPEKIRACYNVHSNEYFGVYTDNNDSFQNNKLIHTSNLPSANHVCNGTYGVSPNNEFPLDQFGLGYEVNGVPYNLWKSIGTSSLGVASCGQYYTFLVTFNGTLPCLNPFTAFPTSSPSKEPSTHPSQLPTLSPSTSPTKRPSYRPSSRPSKQPSKTPSFRPTHSPTTKPSDSPSRHPTLYPSISPSNAPSKRPTRSPTKCPSFSPSSRPSKLPSHAPSCRPSISPSSKPSPRPTAEPSFLPSEGPSFGPSFGPSLEPTATTSLEPSLVLTFDPSIEPSVFSFEPTFEPTFEQSTIPSTQFSPTKCPSNLPLTTRSGTINPTKRPGSFAVPSTKPSSFRRMFPSSTPSIPQTGAPSIRQATLVPSVNPTFANSYFPLASSSPAVGPSSLLGCTQYSIVDLGPSSIIACFSVTTKQYFGIFLATDTNLQSNVIIANQNFPSPTLLCQKPTGGVNFNNQYPLDSYGFAYSYLGAPYNIWKGQGGSLLVCSTCDNKNSLSVTPVGSFPYPGPIPEVITVPIDLWPLF